MLDQIPFFEFGTTLAIDVIPKTGGSTLTAGKLLKLAIVIEDIEVNSLSRV